MESQRWYIIHFGGLGTEVVEFYGTYREAANFSETLPKGRERVVLCNSVREYIPNK